MSKRFFLAGLVLWIGLFALAARWVAAPWLWGSETTPGRPLKTVEAATREFPIHLAKIPASAVGEYLTQISGEEEVVAVDFNARNWAWRETRNRFVVVFLLWLASGFALHWFIGSILRASFSEEVLGSAK